MIPSSATSADEVVAAVPQDCDFQFNTGALLSVSRAEMDGNTDALRHSTSGKYTYFKNARMRQLDQELGDVHGHVRGAVSSACCPEDGARDGGKS